MKLPKSAHEAQPWRIHALVGDFRLEDVWDLPTPGGPDDFPELVRLVVSGGAFSGASPIVRALFALRWKVGALFGWDDESRGLGARVATLRERLPAELRDGPRGPDLGGSPFSPLYMLDGEWAAELANRTVHGVIHLGWVPDGRGGYRGRMAVYAKPNGLLGRAYMVAINPLRHWIVYPSGIRAIGRAWNGARSAASHRGHRGAPRVK